MAEQVFKPSDALTPEERRKAYEQEQANMLREQVRLEAKTQAIERNKIMEEQNFRAASTIMGGATIFAAIGVAWYATAYFLYLSPDDKINFTLFQSIGLVFLLLSVFVGLTAMNRSPARALIWNWTAIGAMFLMGAGMFIFGLAKTLGIQF